MKWRIWVLIGAFSSGAISAPAADSFFPEQYELLPPEKIQDALRLDLYYLRGTFLDSNKSFSYTPGSAQTFQKRVDELIGRKKPLTFGDFAMGVAGAVAAVDDGHTMADVQRVVRHLPIRVAWFGDELRVVRAKTEQAQLLGAQVLKIGGREPLELLKLLDRYVGGADERVKAASPDYLDSPDALQGMGVIANANALEVTLRLRDGKVTTVALAGTLSKQPSATLTGWRDIVPNHRLREEEGWVHVLDGLKQPPVYLQNGDNFYQQVPLPGRDDIFYVRMRITLNPEIYLKRFMEKEPTVIYQPLREYLLERVSEGTKRKQKYLNAIVDLRFNPGGNMMNTLDFARALPRLIDKSGKIYVLTNNQTFSAAIVTTAWFKAFGGDRTVIVGERVGDRERFWAEADLLALPYSEIYVTATQGYHDWGRGCTMLPDCWFNTVQDVAVGSLDPNVRVFTRFDDYVAGRDTVLEKVLSMMADEQPH